DLVAKTITLDQAKTTIQSDTSLAGIDEIYGTNTYAELKNRYRDAPIDQGLSPEDNSTLWSTPVGGYSPVFLGTEYDPETKTGRESYWVIYQVTEKKGSGKPYLQWLEEKRKEYETTNI